MGGARGECRACIYVERTADGAWHEEGEDVLSACHHAVVASLGVAHTAAPYLVVGAARCKAGTAAALAASACNYVSACYLDVRHVVAVEAHLGAAFLTEGYDRAVGHGHCSCAPIVGVDGIVAGRIADDVCTREVDLASSVDAVVVDFHEEVAACEVH